MNALRGMIRFETHAHGRGWGLWAGVVLIAALLVFNGIDGWESAPALLALKLANNALPFIFLVATFTTLHGTGREEHARFADVFYTTPPANATVYTAKLTGAWLPLNVYLGLMALMVLGVALGKGGTDGQFWLCALLVMCETALAVALGIAVAMFLTSIVRNYRSRYVLALLWLLVVIGLAGTLSLWNGRYELFGLGLLKVGEEPYPFSLTYGFYPHVAGWRHGLLQLVFVTLLLVTGRYGFQRHREPRDPRVKKALALVFVLFLTTSGWNAMKWWQWHADIVAEAMYYAHDGGDSVGNDWRYIGGTTPLLPLYQATYPALTFHVSRYNIDLTLPQPGKDASASVVITVQPHGQERLFFTLRRSMHIESIEYSSHADAVSPAMDVAESIPYASYLWQQTSWQRVGDFFSVVVPKEAARLDNLWLRVKYVVEANEVWQETYYRDLVQFLNHKGAYLNARLGWYPLPGGWRLGVTMAEVRNGKRKIKGVTSGLRFFDQESNAYRHMLTADFHVNVKTSAGQVVVTNLPQGIVGQAEWAGRADGLSLYAAPMTTFQAPGLMIAAPAQALRDTEAVGEAFKALRSFYRNVLDIDLPTVSLVVVPRWLDRVYARYFRYAGGDYQKVSLLLGHKGVLREEELAIIARDARRWIAAGKGVDNSLDWATRLLHTAIHKTLWSGPDAQGDYRRNPVGEGITQYLSMLWREQALGSSGLAEYERLLKYFQASAQGELEVDARMPDGAAVKERERRVALVVLRLHEERLRSGENGVGHLLHHLRTQAQQGDVSWETWVDVAEM